MSDPRTRSRLLSRAAGLLTTRPDDRLGFTRGVVVRNPAGHAILFSDR